MDDDELFMQEMAGVKPLKHQPKVTLKKKATPQAMLAARRIAAQAAVDTDKNPLSDGDVDLLDPYSFIEYKRPGVQNSVFRKLKQGKHEHEASLDLHGLTVVQARDEVFNFIKQSHHYDLRTVTVVHGKGQANKAVQAKLKSYVNRWLPDIVEVLAFCSAQSRHGGVGAVYVLLAKNDLKNNKTERV